MRIDNVCYCDICYVTLHLADRRDSVPALFGDRICKGCDNAFTRTRPKSIPMNTNMRRYVRAIESGKKPAPFKMSVTRTLRKGDVTDHLPLELTLGGEVKRK